MNTYSRTRNQLCAILTLFSLALIAPAAQAAQTTPYTINFQGRLSAKTGGVVPDGNYNMKFRLYDAGNSVVFTENYVYGAADHRVAVHNGLFSVQLGSLTALSPALFATGAGALSVEVELPTPATATCASNGCASFTEGAMTPRQPIGASGYALNADLLDGMDSTAFGDATAANQTAMLSRIGTNADAAGAGSLFARLAQIDDTDIGATSDAASSSGSVFARLTDLFNHSGNNNDAASSAATASAHAKLNFLTNLFASSGAVGDVTDSPTGNIFQRMHDLYARVSGIATTLGATNDAGGTTTTGSVNAKLNAILGASGGGGGKTERAQEFTASGNWTAPTGVRAVTVFVVGGGGGGGSSIGQRCAGGGGGGAVVIKTVAVTPGNVYAVTIGQGGVSQGTNIETTGNNGSASSFGSLVSAAGGGGGGTYFTSGNSGGNGGGGGCNTTSTGSGGGGGGAGGSGLTAAPSGNTIVSIKPGGPGTQGSAGGSGVELANGSPAVPGAGGPGLYGYGGGGGATAASQTWSMPGSSGGGASSNSNGVSAQSGAANTGGGGGAMGFTNSGGATAGAGGSGYCYITWWE